MHTLIHNGDIEMVIPQRETRAKRAPIVKTYTAINEIISKSPVFYVRDLWIIEYEQ